MGGGKSRAGLCGRFDRISGHALFRPLPLLSPDFLPSPFDDCQLALDGVVSFPELLQAVLDAVDPF